MLRLEVETLAARGRGFDVERESEGVRMIEIGEWGIGPDGSGWACFRRRVAGSSAKEPGKVSWAALTYHPRLDLAAARLFEHMVAAGVDGEEWRDVTALAVQCSRIGKAIAEACDEVARRESSL